DGYELALRAILGQQVSVKGARTLLGRVVQGAGPAVATGIEGLTHVFPSAEDVIAADWSQLGVPRSRVSALLALSEAVRDGTVDLSPTADPIATRASLIALPGIGEWTADYILMRALRDPDAFPAGDLGLRKALNIEAGSSAKRQLEQRSEAWRPWRAYAALLLWRQLG
ncbi:MAG: AraC family transcriptional regulator of adaptative response / DNA-3-methyladenine glycosylase II, partial [Planctomycetota bacterium]